jgi:hypothetical protein
MTSIRHYNNPHIIKLDRRYKGFVSGFKYRVDFNVAYNGRDNANWERWTRVIAWCENSYGKESFWTAMSLRSAHGFKTSVPKNKQFRQLFLRSEEDLTMMLLVMGE